MNQAKLEQLISKTVQECYFRNKLKDVFSELLFDILQKVSEDRLMKKSEACQYLQFCRESFDKYISPIIPKVKFKTKDSNKILTRYKLSDLQKIIESNYHKEELIQFQSWKKSKIDSICDEVINDPRYKEVS